VTEGRSRCGLTQGQLLAGSAPGEGYSSFGVVHSYGLGLERYENEQITVLGHLGSGAAHSAFLGFDVENGTAAVVMMNSNNPGPQAVIAIETLLAISQAG